MLSIESSREKSSVNVQLRKRFNIEAQTAKGHLYILKLPQRIKN